MGSVEAQLPPSLPLPPLWRTLPILSDARTCVQGSAFRDNITQRLGVGVGEQWFSMAKQPRWLNSHDMVDET